MTRDHDHAVHSGPRGRSTVVLVAFVMLTAGGLTGCGIVSAVRNVAHDVEGNKQIIDAFTNRIKSGEAASFEATYVTTGNSPTTIVYAVKPPAGLAFSSSPSGGGTDESGRLDIVVNSSGEYACTPPSSTSSSEWTCQKLPPVTAATENKVFDFYTPSHWVGFLQGFSLAAGFAGDKVTSSTMTVNGFDMKCVDFRAAGVPGTSTICTTSDGVLGYVRVASDATSFEIKSYSSSPPASLFELPAGARVTTLQPSTT